MKKTILLFTFLTVLYSCSKRSDLVGEWTTEDRYGSKETTIFKEDGSVISIKNNKIVDHSSGEKTLMKYEIDKSHTPYWIDFIVISNNEEMFRMKGIYEILSENTLRVCFNTNTDDRLKVLIRPADFNQGESQILTKK